MPRPVAATLQKQRTVGNGGMEESNSEFTIHNSELPQPLTPDTSSSLRLRPSPPGPETSALASRRMISPAKCVPRNSPADPFASPNSTWGLLDPYATPRLGLSPVARECRSGRKLALRYGQGCGGATCRLGLVSCPPRRRFRYHWTTCRKAPPS